MYAFDILARTGNDVDFRVVCSKGTYIRSLVHEVGVATGVGAHVTRLRRVRIGDLTVEDALRLEELRRAEGESGRLEGGDEG